MATTFPIKSEVLQGNLNAAGFTILNLDLTGLNLTKSSVGLGNVDNTSDANKPISTATAAALAGKEPTILAGTTGQFWRGDKTWQTFGALALQGGATTLPELSAIGAGPTGSSLVAAKRSDWPSSFGHAALKRYGATAGGIAITGIPAANVAQLEFINATYGLIFTNNAAPIVFGTNNVKRMRLSQGLNVGGDGDPGAGCITCYDKMTTAHFVGTDLVLTGDGTMQDLALTGSATVAGSVTTTLGLLVGQNIAAGGNIVATGFILGRPAHLADAAVANDTVFYSTDGSKLSYKDGAGVVHALY